VQCEEGVIHTQDPESGTMAGVCGLVSVWPTGDSPAKSLRANENWPTATITGNYNLGE